MLTGPSKYLVTKTFRREGHKCGRVLNSQYAATVSILRCPCCSVPEGSRNQSSSRWPDKQTHYLCSIKDPICLALGSHTFKPDHAHYLCSIKDPICVALDSHTFRSGQAHLKMDVVQHGLEDFREDKDSFHGSKVEGISHHQGCARGLCLSWLPGYGGYQAVQVHHLHHRCNVSSTLQTQCHGCIVSMYCAEHSVYTLLQVCCHKNRVYSISPSACVTKTASKVPAQMACQMLSLTSDWMTDMA